MMLSHRKRGEPLLALVLVMAGWIGVRALAWESALKAEALADAAASITSQDEQPDNAPRAGHAGLPAAAPRAPAAPALFAPLPTPTVLPPGVFVAPQPDRQPVPAALASAPGGPPPADVQAAPAPMSRIAVAGGHQMLWLAATALLPFPPLGIQTSAPATPQAGTPGAAARGRRWSADGWLLIRRGDGTIAPGPTYGNYGASQAGAVIRYRLDPGDDRKASVYLRATAALNGTREQEAALGLSARPLARVPVVAMAEVRSTRDSAGVRLRPAVALVTELPPQPLAFGFVGEAYAQGGYIGGRNPTAFVDGLVRAERPVADLGLGTLQAGAGAWGAKQRGAARLDLGPVASVRFRLTDAASARLEADWRFRISGKAKPDSGPALTLSAGF